MAKSPFSSPLIGWNPPTTLEDPDSEPQSLSESRNRTRKINNFIYFPLFLGHRHPAGEHLHFEAEDRRAVSLSLVALHTKVAWEPNRHNFLNRFQAY